MNFRDHERIEIRFGGSGGQGLVLASIILAEALAEEDYHVITSESHGIEARGGASLGELICSRGEVYDLNVQEPDIFITIHQEATTKHYKTIKKDALVIVDSFMVKDIPPFDSRNVYAFPFTQLVKEKLDTTLPTNIAFLGTLTAMTDLIKLETMKKSVLNRVPPRFKELNTTAFELGIELAKNAKPITIESEVVA